MVDAIDTRATPADHEDVDFILKWNPRKEEHGKWATRIFSEGEVGKPREGKRVGLLTVGFEQQHEGKTYRFGRVMRAVERTIDRKGQLFLIPEIELEGWWSTPDLSAKEIIRFYEDHGTSEQLHNKLKSDLDLEGLPSGKFATNALILTLGGLACNLLRAIGQIEGASPVRHPAKRRRIKAVIQELMYLAARLIKIGRRLKLLFGRHCPAFEAFETVYAKPAAGWWMPAEEQKPSPPLRNQGQGERISMCEIDS